MPLIMIAGPKMKIGRPRNAKIMFMNSFIFELDFPNKFKLTKPMWFLVF